MKKYRVKMQVPVEKRGLFGIKKTVMETRIVEMDEKTYRKMKQKRGSGPITLDEMIFYDMMDGD